MPKTSLLHGVISLLLCLTYRASGVRTRSSSAVYGLGARRSLAACAATTKIGSYRHIDSRRRGAVGLSSGNNLNDEQSAVLQTTASSAPTEGIAGAYLSTTSTRRTALYQQTPIDSRPVSSANAIRVYKDSDQPFSGTSSDVLNPLNVPIHETESASRVSVASSGEASMASSIFSLSKSIVGMGVLALPAGLAYINPNPSAVSVATAGALVVLFGLMGAYSFSLIGELCEEHQCSTFTELWSKTVSASSAKLIPAVITSMCLLTPLVYSIMIGDAFAELFKAASLPKVIASRNGALVLITATILAPLCSLQSLHALYPFSVAGLIGTFLTAAVMAVRFFDGTYQLPSVPTPGTSAAMSGLTFITIPRLNKLLASSSASLVFVSAISDFLTRRSFVLLSMLSTAFVAHYHAPRLYNELKDRNTSRFNTVVYTGFSISTALYVLMMSVGYLTFGGSSQGFILNNYATNDRLASIARAAVGLSLITGYPLIFFALRDSLLDLLSQREAVYKSLSTTRSVSTGLLVLLTAVSMMLKDVGLVVSLTGALCGCTLMFVFPAFMSIKSNSARRTQLYADQLNLEYSVKSRFSSPAVLPDPIRQEVARIRSLINRSYISSGTSLAMITTGVLMAALGVYVSLAKELGIGL